MRKLLFLVLFVPVFLFMACEDETKVSLENKYEEALNFYESGNNVESLKLLNKLLSNDHSPSETLARAYFLRGFVHNMENSSRLAYEDYLRGLELFDVVGIDKMIAATYYQMGEIFYEQELFDQSYYYFSLALNHTNTSSKMYKGFYHYGLGKSLRRLGQFDESLTHYIKARDIQHGIKNYHDLAKVEIELGILQLDVGNYDQALKHFNEVEELADLTRNPDSNLWKTYNNIGNVYLNNGDWEKAEEHFKKSLKYEKNDSQLSVTYNNLGKIYNKKGDYEQAWYCFKKSLTYNSQNLEFNELAITNDVLKKTFEKLNQPDSLLHYTMLINDLAIPAIETKAWLKGEERKIALLNKYQNYLRDKAEQEQYAKTSWLMAFIMTFIFMSGVLSVRLWKIYNYKSPQKGHDLIKNSNEMVYLLDMLKKEKDEMKKVMDQKLKAS